MIVKIKEHKWLQEEILEKVRSAAWKVMSSFFLSDPSMKLQVNKAIRKAVLDALRPYEPEIPWMDKGTVPDLLASYVDVDFEANTLPPTITRQSVFWTDTFSNQEGKFQLRTARLESALDNSGLVVNADDPRAVAEIIRGQ
jgi:hypothetical protein